MTAVRRLNGAGIAAFRGWLVAGCPGDLPTHLLTDQSVSEALGTACTVEVRPFGTRFEFGEYLVERLSALSPSAIRFDVGLWDWLSLLYFDQLCPPKADGSRKPQELVRYALELSGRKWSRHFVRMSWMSVQEHGDNARVMLSVPMATHPDILEQLAGTQETFGSKTVIALARRLYWDETGGKTKRGAQAKGRGTPRRLSKILRQLRRTWDPGAMTPIQLQALLPVPEFSRWEAPAQ
jgi:hypothetical protein